MTEQAYKHIFGPVLSRRLGRSLGVDIMPFKTCSYDCVYCEQGRTTNHTLHREEYVPVSSVLDELRRFLDTRPAPDYITLSGAGEPTLHARLGDIVDGIKSLTPVPLAVITNGSLLWQATVRNALTAAEVVLPSLDAGNEELFRRIDRPVADLSFEQMVTGMVEFRTAFPGEIWLEVLLLDGITSGEAEVREIAAWARLIRPERIQLNTVVRPPSESFARPVPRETLEALAGLFEPHAEIIADYGGALAEFNALSDTSRVLEVLRRRPCSAKQLADTLGMRMTEVSKFLQGLAEQKMIDTDTLGDIVFYKATSALYDNSTPGRQERMSL